MTELDIPDFFDHIETLNLVENQAHFRFGRGPFEVQNEDVVFNEARFVDPDPELLDEMRTMMEFVVPEDVEDQVVRRFMEALDLSEEEQQEDVHEYLEERQFMLPGWQIIAKKVCLIHDRAATNDDPLYERWADFHALYDDHLETFGHVLSQFEFEFALLSTCRCNYCTDRRLWCIGGNDAAIVQELNVNRAEPERLTLLTDFSQEEVMAARLNRLFLLKLLLRHRLSQIVTEMGIEQTITELRAHQDNDADEGDLVVGLELQERRETHPWTLIAEVFENIDGNCLQRILQTSEVPGSANDDGPSSEPQDNPSESDENATDDLDDSQSESKTPSSEDHSEGYRSESSKSESKTSSSEDDSEGYRSESSAQTSENETSPGTPNTETNGQKTDSSDEE